MERLQKLLAQAGVASRRASEQLILAGRVSVNGVVVTELGTKADPSSSEIAVDGKPIQLSEEIHAFIFHKPVGVLTSRADDRGRKVVTEFIPSHLRTMVYPVGRLDLNSSGLVLLLNDGALAFRLTHPSFHVAKEYIVRIARALEPDELKRMQTGIELDDGVIATAQVTQDSHNHTLLHITLYEGRKRQIRRMIEALGNEVRSLHRVSIGPLQLGKLASGKARKLTEQELANLRQAVGLDA